DRVPRGESLDCDSHANELQQSMDGKGLPLSQVRARQCIAALLEQSSYTRSGWRKQLSDSLLALNDGEVQFLTKPSRTKKHGRQFTLRQLQRIAVLHVHVLMGGGMKKYAAETRIADELAVSVETLRAWEKRFLRENKGLKQDI